jgi:hypothetical protein
MASLVVKSVVWMRRAVASIGVAALLGAVPAHAEPARWLGPDRVVSPSGEHPEQPAVAVGSEGRTLVAWNSERVRMGIGPGKIEARLGHVGRSWARPQTLSPDGEGPVAAVGANGTAAVAWSTKSRGHHETQYVSVAAPGHGFGKARAVWTAIQIEGRSNAAVISGLEVQPSGRVVVVWSYPLPESPEKAVRNAIDYGLLEPGSMTWHTGTIGVSGSDIGNVAQGETGVVSVAFGAVLNAYPPAINTQALLATLPVEGSSFSAPQLIYAVPGEIYGEAENITALAGPGGEGVMFNAIGGIRGEPNVFETIEQPAGATSASRVAATGLPWEEELPKSRLLRPSVSVALPADGSQVGVWSYQELSREQGGHILASGVAAVIKPANADAFTLPVQISRGRGIPDSLLVGAAGSATIALWIQSVGCKERLVYAVRPSGGIFSAPSTLVNSLNSASPYCTSRSPGGLVLSDAGNYAIVGSLWGSAVHVTTLEG